MLYLTVGWIAVAYWYGCTLKVRRRREGPYTPRQVYLRAACWPLTLGREVVQTLTLNHWI